MPFVLDYVLPNKRNEIQKAADNFREIDSSKVISLKNALVLPVVSFHDYDVSAGRGGVVDAEGCYVELSKTRARVVNSYEVKNEECSYVDKKIVFCGYFHRAWGHFITESVSRLWYALKKDETIDSYVFIIERGTSAEFKNNYFEFLKLLGIEDKTIIINQPTRFSEVIIPEEGFVYSDHFTTNFRRMYQKLSEKAMSQYHGPQYDKIYFSKSKLESSIMSNLNYRFVDDFFVKNGFKIFYPEQLNLIDMIGIIQGCSQFAAISSSLAHNFLFGRDDQTTISIEKQAYYNPYQIFVSKIINCNSIFIDASRTVFPVGSYGPFIYDYTTSFDKFAKENNMIPFVPMSDFKLKRVFKKYMIYYFNIHPTLPPDYMYRQSVLSLEREAYEETVREGRIFQISLYQRIIIKLKKIILKLKNRF